MFMSTKGTVCNTYCGVLLKRPYPKRVNKSDWSKSEDKDTHEAYNKQSRGVFEGYCYRLI